MSSSLSNRAGISVPREQLPRSEHPLLKEGGAKVSLAVLPKDSLQLPGRAAKLTSHVTEMEIGIAIPPADCL